MKQFFTERTAPTWSLSLVCAILSLALGFAFVVPAHASEDSSDTELSITTPLDTQVVRYEQLDLDGIAARASAIELQRPVGFIKTFYKWKSRNTNFTPASRVPLNWANTQIYKYGNQYIVDVPFANGVDRVSKVLFIWDNETVHIQEIFAQMESDNQVHIFGWYDSEATIDTIVVNHNVELPTGDANATGATPSLGKGPNWSRFNSCLSSKGIGWAAISVLSVICGAACAATAGIGCAPCLAAAAAGNGGIIGYCLPLLWK